jgi:hypothetical protein
MQPYMTVCRGNQVQRQEGALLCQSAFFLSSFVVVKNRESGCEFELVAATSTTTGKEATRSKSEEEETAEEKALALLPRSAFARVLVCRFN